MKIALDFLRNPDLGFWVLFIIGVLSLYWVIRFIWNDKPIRWIYFLRSLIFVSLIVGLMQPRLTNNRAVERELPWYVFVDNSLSMNYHTNISNTTINNGLQNLLQRFDQLNILYHIYPFSGDVEDEATYAEITGTGMATDLGKVLKFLREKKPYGVGGAVLVTDGQATQGLDPVSESSDVGIPIMTLAVGDTTPMVDVAIQSIDAPTITIKGDDIVATVTVAGFGPIDERLNVSLESGKELLGSKFIRLHGNGSQTRVSFHFSPDELGVNSYRVSVSSLSEEINIKNNRQVFDVSVLKDEYHIAIITGGPSVNTSLLKRWLRKQPRVELTHIIQDSPGYESDMKNFWPTSYDLMVFENYPLKPLQPRTQRILARKIASQSSAVLWINGPNLQKNQVESILPLVQSRLQPISDSLDATEPWEVRMTDHVNKLPVYIPAITADGEQVVFPPFTAQYNIISTSDESWSLLDFPVSGIPVLMLNEKENLRSAVWSTSTISHMFYKMLYSGDEHLSESLFNGMIAWLMKTGGDQDLFFRLNKESYQQGEEIKITGNRIGGDSSPFSDVSLTLWKDSVQVNTYDFQYNSLKERWEGAYWASTPGKYEFEIQMTSQNVVSRQAGSYHVNESQVELNNVFVNGRVLKSISEESGGEFYTWEKRNNMTEALQSKMSIQKSTIRFIPTESWWSLLIILILLGTEWSLRRLKGLM